jgi:protein-tyrosine phosphatase
VERRIELEGCHNFRDLGGYPACDGRRVRWRALFRADDLSRLTSAGVAVLRDELRVGIVVDLRSANELAGDGPRGLDAEPIRFHHHPLFAGVVRGASRGVALADIYFALLETAREPMARVIATLAGADVPAVFHCAAGKDRTGIVSAVLLGLLGVADEVVVDDYAASQAALGPLIERLLADASYREMLAALPPETLHARPETMAAMLTRVRDGFGSMRGYAREIGVPDAVVERLASRLLVG